MWSGNRRKQNWVAGTATVDGNLDSDQPTWILTAKHGRQRIDLASGPHPATRQLAEQAAAIMNSIPTDEWDNFIEHHLAELTKPAWG